MIIFNIILKNIVGQVIFLCNTNQDCHKNYYCNNLLQCSDCSNIHTNNCNVYDLNCCSDKFLNQCINNPYHCKTIENYQTKSTFNPLLFIMTFPLISYIIIGSCYNKRIKNKKGKEIIPNIYFWEELFGLVKDGVYFSCGKCQNCFKYRLYNRII